MDKFEQREMKKIRLIKGTWYNWLIKVTLRQTHLNKLYMGEERN